MQNDEERTVLKRVLVLSILIFSCFVSPVFCADSIQSSAAKTKIMAADEGSQYLAVGFDNRIDIYELQTRKLFRTITPDYLDPENTVIDSLAVNPVNAMVAVGLRFKDGQGRIPPVYLIGLDGKLYASISGLPGAVSRLAFSRDGRYLAISTVKKYALRIYRLSDPVITYSYSELPDLSPGEKKALKAFNGIETITLIPELIAEDKNIAGDVTALTFDGNGRLALSAQDGRIRLYDQSFKYIKEATVKNGTQPNAVSFDADGSRLAVSYADADRIDILSGNDLSYLSSPDTKKCPAGSIHSLAWSGDGGLLYLKEQEKGAEVAFIDDGRPRTVLDRKYGTFQNELGSVWAAVGHKVGDVTYQIGGYYTDYQNGGIVGYENFPTSELKWPINTLFGEIGTELRLGKYLELRGSFFHNITNNLTGDMQDSDWTTNTEIRDIYSESSTNFEGYGFDASLRFWLVDRQLKDNQSWSLGIGAGFLYQSYSWQAHNVDQWSPAGTYYAAGQHVYVGGLAGTYDAKIKMTYIELVFKSRINKFELSGSIGGSPYVKTSDQDEHLLRYLSSSGDADGYALKVSLEGKYSFRKNWYTALSFNMIYLDTDGSSETVGYAGTEAGTHYVIEEKIKSRQYDFMLSIGHQF